MAVLKSDRHSLFILQFLSHFAHRFQIANWLADQFLGFIQCGRKQRRERKQLRFVKGNCIRTQKEIATGCDHHRIDDERNAIVDLTNRIDNCASDRFDDSDRIEQPCLGGSNWEISGEYSDLFVHSLATDWLDPRNFPWSFRGDTGDSRQAVNTERRKSFKVGL